MICAQKGQETTITVYSISYSRCESFKLHVISYQDNKMDPESKVTNRHVTQIIHVNIPTATVHNDMIRRLGLLSNNPWCVDI
jgi:hypothetical protein